MESAYENRTDTTTRYQSVEMEQSPETETTANVSVTRINYEGVEVGFNKPLLFDLKRENSFYVAENTSLNIICYNETLVGLYSDISEELYILWTEFVLYEDSKLDSSGIKLKEKLLSLKK